MSRRIFVPADSTARSLGADAVAEVLSTLDIDIEIVRTGSRGLYWLEPLLEIETDEGRIGFGPVAADQAAALFATGIPDADHKDCLGLVEELDYLKPQQRLTTARVGITDPLSLGDYAAHGGWQGLEKARQLDSAGIVDIVTHSGLRGGVVRLSPLASSGKPYWMQAAGIARNTSSAMPMRVTQALSWIA